MKRSVYVTILLLFCHNLIYADYQVLVAASRDKVRLAPVVSALKQNLSRVVPVSQIAIVPSGHPVWKWRAGITGLQNREKAERILRRVQRIYPSAYIHAVPLVHLMKRKHHTKRNSPKTTPEETVTINFSDLSIMDFIHMVSKITGKNILVTEKIEGNVNFIGNKPIPKSKLLPLLNQVLASKKLTLIDNGQGYLKIVNRQKALKSGPVISDKNGIDQIQTAILPLKTLKAIDVMKQANSLVSKSGKISVSNETNSIIVTDFPENIRAIREIVDALNAGKSAKNIRFIPFRNSPVDEAFSKISRMVRSYFSSYPKSQQVTLIQSSSANSIVAVGDPQSIRKIYPAIKAFDRSADQKNKEIEMVVIKNTDAAEVANLLNELVSSEDFSKNVENMSEELSGNTAKAKKSADNKIKVTVKHRVKTGKAASVKITYDKHLNAVMLFGTKKERQVLKRIIKKLDIERKQVYVKARILEINDKKASQIGMQYGILGGVSNSSGLYALSSRLGLNDPKTAVNIAGNLGIKLPNVSKILALGAAVSLLSENAAADIISEPSILCINNEASSIYVGKTISVVSQSSVATSTTDLSRNTYSREDIGLTLDILPRISSDNKVTLGIKITSEDILPGSMVGLPKTTKRVVKTSAIVKNGESVIIGGMAREKESKNRSGVPVLRNIPLFGKLFEREDVDRERTTLVLILTPYIINKSTDLSELKEELGKLYLFEQNFAKKHSKRVL